MLWKMAKLHSSLWLSNIPLCVCVCVRACEREREREREICTGCFHNLVLVNSAAMNIRVCRSYQISVFIFLYIYKYLEVELLDHTTLFQVFWGNSILLSKFIWAWNILSKTATKTSPFLLLSVFWVFCNEKLLVEKKTTNA